MLCKTYVELEKPKDKERKKEYNRIGNQRGKEKLRQRNSVHSQTSTKKQIDRLSYRVRDKERERDR